MICYQDRTFCNACCNNQECPRKYTEQIRIDANKWWGEDGAPIAFSDYSYDCDEWEG